MVQLEAVFVCGNDIIVVFVIVEATHTYTIFTTFERTSTNVYKTNIQRIMEYPEKAACVLLLLSLLFLFEYHFPAIAKRKTTRRLDSIILFSLTNTFSYIAFLSISSLQPPHFMFVENVM